MTKFFTDSDLQGLDQGPLGSIIPAYTAFLSKQGYTKHSTQLQLRFLTDMSQWLRRQQVQVADLTMSTIHRYMRSRYKRLRPRRDDNSILNRLLHMLHTEGLLMEETPQSPSNPHQRVQQDFDRYLSAERGLSVSTRNNYLPFIHQFLSAQFGDKSARFAALNAKDVIRFVQKQAPRLNPKRAGLMVSALRCFFRYLRHRGDIENDLAACVPSIANWRFSTLPKFLQPHQVQEVLRQCDCRTAHGRRDYAILLLLARLGLRACEIVSLNLDDIHWQAGEIRIQGKGNKPALLPLPPDVGQAIAAYLKKD